ncbi:hypothetical protein V6560_000686 [Vibrio parahaemolyticus]
MIAIIVMIMIFLSFSIVVSYNLMSVNHNLVISADIEQMDQELRVIKQKIIKSAIPILSSNQFALPFGQSLSNEHRLPENLGIPLINNKGHYYQYCPYGLDDDGSSMTAKVYQNDGSFYEAETTEINGVEYAVKSNSPPVNVGAPNVAAFVISKFESAKVSCSDIKYDSDSNAFYLTTAKVLAITTDEIQAHNELDLSDTSFSLNLDNESASTILSVIENDTSNRSYVLMLNENVSLTQDHLINRDSRTDISLNLNGYSLSNQTLEFDNVDLDIYSNSLKLNPSATHIEANNSDLRLIKVSFGGLTASNSEVYAEDTFTNVQFAHHINLVNSRLTLSDKLQFNVSNSFTSLFNLVGSELLVNADIKEKTATSKGDSIFKIDTGSKVHLHQASLTIFNAMASGSNIVDVKGKFTTSSSGNTFTMSNTANVQNIINVDGGELHLDSFKSNSTKHKGFTINQELKNGQAHGSVLVRSTAGIEAGESGCLRLVKDKIYGDKIVQELQDVQC